MAPVSLEGRALYRQAHFGVNNFLQNNLARRRHRRVGVQIRQWPDALVAGAHKAMKRKSDACLDVLNLDRGAALGEVQFPVPG
jgi:hypothetical protein